MISSCLAAGTTNIPSGFARSDAILAYCFPAPAPTEAEARLREATKLGFDQALCPALPAKANGVKATTLSRLTEAVERISANRY